MLNGKKVLFVFCMVMVLLVGIVVPFGAYAADFPANPTTKTGYTLDFQDEFNGTSLDSSKWIDSYLPHWCDNPTTAKGRYSFSNGCLVQRIDSDQAAWCPEHDGTVKSSAIMSFDKSWIHNFSGTTDNHDRTTWYGYATTYGYFEIRAKQANCGGGGHQAWWMVGMQQDTNDWFNSKQTAEFDIIETFFSSPNTWRIMAYGWNDPNFCTSWTGWQDPVPSGDQTSEFHVYAMDWSANSLKFYYDNQLYKTINDAPDYPMGTILNIYTDAGSGTHNDVWPKQWYVDYLRVWKKNATEIPAVPTGLATAVVSTSQINTTWNNQADATGYDLERDGTVVSSATSPNSHTGLTASSSHTYRVRAKNSMGTSAWSSSVSATTYATGVTNLALNKTATAINQQDAAHAPSKAVDGNTSTMWIASNGTANNWWKVDLGQNYSLNGSEITFENGNNIWKYKVEVSTDNTNWTMVADKTTNTSTAQIQAHSFTATARYVRVTVTLTPGTAWTAFGEFKVLGTSSVSNLALNKTATAISQEDATRAPSKAVDGNTSTMWVASNGTANNWWKVDLGQNYSLNGSEITFENGNNIWKYKVEVSTDNTNWTMVADKTTNTSTAQIQAHSFTATARYVRVTVTLTPGTAWTAFSEFKVLGT